MKVKTQVMQVNYLLGIKLYYFDIYLIFSAFPVNGT